MLTFEREVLRFGLVDIWEDDRYLQVALLYDIRYKLMLNFS